MTRPILLVALLCSGPALAAPKYYFLLRDIENAQEVGADRVRDLFLKELAKHPLDFVPPGTNDSRGSNRPTDGAALGRKLAAEKVKGYFVSLRLLGVTREVKERPGKRPLLERGVKVSLIGTTIPGAVAAFSGEGEAAAGVELIRHQVDEAEAASVLSDALSEAIGQAVQAAVNKLRHPPAPPPTTKRRTTKRR